MRIYERSDDIREYYKCSKTFNIENNRSAIVQLAVSPSEDSLIGQDTGGLWTAIN